MLWDNKGAKRIAEGVLEIVLTSLTSKITRKFVYNSKNSINIFIEWNFDDLISTFSYQKFILFFGYARLSTKSSMGTQLRNPYSLLHAHELESIEEEY